LKLLLDQNISKRIVPTLQTSYSDSSQVYLEGLEKASDKDIWEFSKKNKFTVVTKDSDFHELAIIYGPPPKIIWLKCGNQNNQFILDLLLNKADEIHDFISDLTAVCLEIY